MAIVDNPFDYVDKPPVPLHRVPVFSTMGRGPRGEKGDGIITVNSSDFPPTGSYQYGTLLSVTDTGELYMFIESNEWQRI